jgi:hypothetical protein
MLVSCSNLVISQLPNVLACMFAIPGGFSHFFNSEGLISIFCKFYFKNIFLKSLLKELPQWKYAKIEKCVFVSNLIMIAACDADFTL